MDVPNDEVRTHPDQLTGSDVREEPTPRDETPYVLTVRFPPEFRDRLRFAALVRDTTIADLVTTAVRTFLVGVESSADYRQLVEILRATTDQAALEPER